MNRSMLLAGLAAILAWPAALAQPPHPGTAAPLVVAGKQAMPQRVLLRPGATLHPQPGATEFRPGIGFAAYYVYARQGSGSEEWVQLGAGLDGRTEGWAKAERTLGWNHGMVAALTNPAGRGRSLFMENEEAAHGLIYGDGPVQAERLRREAAAGRPAEGVLALEPERFIDISKQFYLLPILGAKMVERETGGPIRILEVASAPADPVPPPAGLDPLAGFRAGVVFVVDTTISMQPYIDRTREAMQGVVDTLRNTALRDSFRFGVIGYRDSRSATPEGFEYDLKIFALPDFSQPIEQAVQAMAGVAAARTGNQGFDENPAAGLKEALDKVDWAKLGGRYMVLITDAGAREASDPLSSTGLGLEEIRQQAKLQGVFPFVIHLLTPEGRSVGNHPKARRQYVAFTETSAGSLYYPVPDGSQEEFRGIVATLTEGLLQQVAATVGRPVAELRGAGGGARSARSERMTEQLRVVGEAMRLAYLGRQERTTAPDIVRSFVLDRDPAPRGPTAIDVRVLLTRNQLSDLAQTMENILRAGRASRVDPAELFRQLQSALALAARNPRQIAQPGSLGTLLGEFLDGLPYVSEVMSLTQDDWLAMGPSAQAALLNKVEAKARLYQEFNRNADLWVTLTGRRDPGEQLLPVPLEALP